MLLDGFSKISSRWLFMSTKPKEIYSRSSLLLGTCMLAGFHSIPSMHGSETHHSLYQHIHGLLGRRNLASTASLDTIQAMLIFSMWDLRPTREYDHGNSWMVSGMAAMHVVMTTRFDNLLCANSDDSPQHSQAQEYMRTWNLICLCQLQFSVGSGRPPVIAKQYFDQCANILDFPSYNSRDQLVFAGVELYRTLWDLISSNVVPQESATWPEIDRLRKSHSHIYKLDSSEPLRFAYSCTYLILARRSLQCLNHPPIDNNPEAIGLITADHKLPFIEEAISSSEDLLKIFLSMSDLTTYIHPAYETLLSSFAMVTLAEFVSYIPDVSKALTLMENTISHIQHGGKAEPVSRWSLNIVRQHLLGTSTQESSVQVGTDNNSDGTTTGITDEALKSWEEGYLNLDQEFPSLQDMFSLDVV
ncbi:hypothetical protein N7468_005500 [Penicillium chermesinum]|uniref:Transcription factor domain-containing protein n=1 Tax=Penicillium chermesinum TaxID=63820 RepID=A0A9W9NZD6_9EURO|nr:uncharacterized protein N7468_005500 [Penicillium chermesinum]KAJ5232544.1 hypothetical protein N7468_005500 [Penicillium chermesinum]KAJ6172201.1 hypothetical protein N7470_001268 [Penicillium chermesinum]